MTAERFGNSTSKDVTCRQYHAYVIEISGVDWGRPTAAMLAMEESR
jgi:hypothetical protein